MVTRTQAALIIVNSIEGVKRKTPNYFDLHYFIQSLCKATFILSGKNKYEDVNSYQKDQILFSFTDSCYFLFEGFGPEDEEMIDVGLMLNGSQPYSEVRLSEYFDKNICDLHKIDESVNFIISHEPSIITSHVLPSLEEHLAQDIYKLINLLKKKDRVFRKIELEELLIYYTLSLLIEYQSKAGLLTNNIINSIFNQVESASKMVLNFDYDEVDPRKSIMINFQKKGFVDLSNTYMDYLLME